MMDWHPVQGVSRLHTQCFKDKIQTHCNCDQDKKRTEGEEMNEWDQESNG